MQCPKVRGDLRVLSVPRLVCIYRVIFSPRGPRNDFCRLFLMYARQMCAAIPNQSTGGLATTSQSAASQRNSDCVTVQIPSRESMDMA